MFYVYEYYNTETLEVFYVGKGTRNRYRVIAGRNELFLKYYQNNTVFCIVYPHYPQTAIRTNQRLLHCELLQLYVGSTNNI